jgi:hypothetical protein
MNTPGRASSSAPAGSGLPQAATAAGREAYQSQRTNDRAMRERLLGTGGNQ